MSSQWSRWLGEKRSAVPQKADATRYDGRQDPKEHNLTKRRTGPRPTVMCSTACAKRVSAHLLAVAPTPQPLSGTDF